MLLFSWELYSLFKRIERRSARHTLTLTTVEPNIWKKIVLVYVNFKINGFFYLHSWNNILSKKYVVQFNHFPFFKSSHSFHPRRIIIFSGRVFAKWNYSLKWVISFCIFLNSSREETCLCGFLKSRSLLCVLLKPQRNRENRPALVIIKTVNRFWQSKNLMQIKSFWLLSLVTHDVSSWEMSKDRTVLNFPNVALNYWKLVNNLFFCPKVSKFIYIWTGQLKIVQEKFQKNNI